MHGEGGIRGGDHGELSELDKGKEALPGIFVQEVAVQGPARIGKWHGGGGGMAQMTKSGFLVMDNVELLNPWIQEEEGGWEVGQ